MEKLMVKIKEANLKLSESIEEEERLNKIYHTCYKDYEKARSLRDNEEKDLRKLEGKLLDMIKKN